MEPKEKYHVVTFGCRVNQADSAGIGHALRDASLDPASHPKDADVVVLNTCTVTHRSDADVRKAVHRIQRDNPNARVIVAGCSAQRDPDALVQLSGVHAVVGNAHRDSIPELARSLVRQAPVQPEDSKPIVMHTALDKIDRDDLPAVKPIADVWDDRTRPFVKIQDGCDAACTYCIIPKVRGKARSASPEAVLAAVTDLIEQGFFEVVLAGIHLGTYGRGLATNASLLQLVRRALKLPNLGRLRLSCIEPMAFPLELAELAAENPRLAPHFHLPLQAGSDRVLKRMARPYRAADFAKIINHIRATVPEACIGTDVIVGFPGESQEDFDETLAFVESSVIDYVHVFSYSDRTDTPADRLGPKVDPRIIKERSQALHKTANRLWHRFLDRQIGQTLPVLTLAPRSSQVGQAIGLSANYCPISLPGAKIAPNQNVPIKIMARHEDSLVGQITA